MPGSSQNPGSALVLVVEDESLVRMVAADVIQEAGYDVIEAGNADEALQILEKRADIRLIITDIDMPPGSMNGLGLAAAVKNRWPTIKIIVVSGHYQATKADMPADSIFLAKPYEPEQLIAHVRRFAA